MIHTQRGGAAGGLPTLFAHCFLGHSGMWRGLIEAMNPTPETLAFDLPGHGRSAMPEQPGDLHAEVAEIIDGLVEQPMLLIGHSFGGASMLRFALKNPDRVLGLVLFEPVFIAAGLAEQGVAAQDFNDGFADAVRDERHDDAARAFYEYNDPSRRYDDLPEEAKSVMRRQMRLLPATEPGVVHDSGGLLSPGLMDGFAPPVLLLGGACTPPLFPPILRGLHRRLNGAELVEIAEAGHMLPLTHAAECGSRIDAWRARHGLAG